MKTLRLMIVPVLLAFLVSCDSDRQNATLGNSSDTANTEEGAAVAPSVGIDSAKNDSTTSTQGNATPTGRIKEQ